MFLARKVRSVSGNSFKECLRFFASIHATSSGKKIAKTELVATTSGDSTRVQISVFDLYDSIDFLANALAK